MRLKRVTRDLAEYELAGVRPPSTYPRFSPPTVHGAEYSAPCRLIWRAPEPDRQRANSIHIVDLTGIFTVCCLMAADLGSVIFSTPLEKSVFTDLGSGPNGRVIERENLPNVRS